MPPAKKPMPGTHILGLPSDTLQTLAESFEQSDVVAEAARADGFVPRSIEWTKITKRLDEAFKGGWSWEVLEVRMLPYDVMVHGRLSVVVMNVLEGAIPHVQKLIRDGIGTNRIRLTADGTHTVDMGYDIKAATTDALKRASVLLRVAVQLYENTTAQTDDAPEMAPPPADPRGIAQPFQVQQVVELLQNQLGLPQQYWCQQLGLQNPAALTAGLAQEIISQTHQIVQQHIKSGTTLSSPPPGFVTSSA